MPRSNSKFFTSLVVGAIVLIALNVFWFGWIPHTAIGKTWASSLFVKSGKLHNLASSIFRWRELAQENSDLSEKMSNCDWLLVWPIAMELIYCRRVSMMSVSPLMGIWL